jgi:N-acetyl-anhydromuramyl-L-alanine amidase AmpD
MVQSPEYPDLAWIPPRSWTNANRKSVQLIVMHTTQGNVSDMSAENGANYSAERTDGTSAHYYCDSNSIVHCVRTADVAHTARSEGNKRGIHYELCTKAESSSSTWANAYHTAMLQRAAKQCAKDAKKWNIPVRHVTVSQLKDGEKGFCSHHDITLAFRQSTHTDPGPNFPWTRFLTMVQNEMDGIDMDEKTIAQAVASKFYADLTNSQGSGLKNVMTASEGRVVTALSKQITELNKALVTAIQALVSKDMVDEQTLAESIASAVLAGLPENTDITQEELNAAIKSAFREGVFKA